MSAPQPSTRLPARALWSAALVACGGTRPAYYVTTDADEFRDQFARHADGRSRGRSLLRSPHRWNIQKQRQC
jgi:hypothetical protein